MMRQRGFTLIELLIGSLIGIIGMMLILQTQEGFDRYKRGLTSGGEAQVAGTVAAFQLERAIRNAGMGFGASPLLGCQVDVSLGGNALNMWLAPVRIVDGGAGPDEIQILSGNSETPSSSYNVVCSDVTFGTDCTGSGTAQLDTTAGLRVGDMAVMTTPGIGTGCRMVQIASVNADGRRLTTGGNYTSTDAALTFDTNPTNRFLYNLGTPPAAVRTATDVAYTSWRVNVTRTADLGANTLIRAELLRAPLAWGEIADSVVDLQAQYGLVATNPPLPAHVARWTSQDPTTADALDPVADPTGWTRVGMIRFAMLIRGQQRETTRVTTAPPVWLCGAAMNSTQTCPFTMRNIDGTADSGVNGPPDNNWRYYRYQVQEVTVPLRNVIWRTAW